MAHNAALNEWSVYKTIVPQRIDKYQKIICVSDIIQINEETW